MSLYLSRLTLNANHPRTESELAHPYELHRTICRGFHDPPSARILFRSDADSPGVVHVIVQSLLAPDWSRLGADPEYHKDTDEPKKIALASLAEGVALKFRLRCRPSKRIAAKDHPEHGKRKSITDRDEIFAWLHRKAEESGFQVRDVAFDRVYWHDSKDGKQEKPLGGVQFDGVLIVTDPDRLREALANGIGTQKAFGFGLLSLASMR